MSELRFEFMKIRGSDLGAEACVPDLLGEHILQNNLEFRLSEDDEIYEGYGRKKNAYPYRQYNNYTRQLKELEIKTAVLENNYLKAVFLPEYGGRLWELWDKTTGTNLLYTNDVLRFSNLAVRNAWFSGGVEWNIGVIGHTPYTTAPMYTAVSKMPSGVPVLRMYEYERIRKVPYQIDFWLENDDRFLNCRIRIVNERADVVPMYWWSNIAVPEYENGCIVVPAKSAFTYADGAVYKVDIPIVDGIDVTDYKKIPKSVDYFFDIEDRQPKYIANLNSNGYGLLHVSSDRLRSRKLFSWGNNQASDHWQEFLTDKAGRYVEIQAGLAKTQYGCIPMAPHTTWEWIEQYGPVTLPKTVKNKSHAERAAVLTKFLKSTDSKEVFNKKLADTRDMAKQRADLVMAGSGYGALVSHGKYTSHLTFCLSDESLQKWQHFFETGILHKPDVMAAPDEFLIDEKNLSFLIDTLTSSNKDNWYAFYHAGIGAFAAEDFERSEIFLHLSFEKAKNPWACHGLACVCLLTGRKEEGAKWILNGMEMEHTNISYMKEGFKLLYLCGAYRAAADFYEKQDSSIQTVGKLKFYYLSSLHRLGEDKKAYELLEENGGLIIDDIREGEDSVAQLWSDLYENLFSKKAPVPYRYDFKAF